MLRNVLQRSGASYIQYVQHTVTSYNIHVAYNILQHSVTS